MAAKPGQKTFHAEVEESLHTALERWRSAHKDPSQKQCIIAGVELFLALPEPVQSILMICPRDSRAFEVAATFASEAVLSLPCSTGAARDEAVAGQRQTSRQHTPGKKHRSS